MNDLPPAAAVLLARLLAGPAKPTPAVRKDVSAAIGPVDDGAWAAAVAAAVDGGLAVATAGAPKAVKSAKPKDVPLVLSGDGRTAARDRLGVVADRPTLTAGTIAGFWKHRDPTPSAAAVLVTRLYVSAAKPPTHKAARKFVGDVVGPIDDGAWAAAVASVSAAGYLHDGPPAAAVAKAGKAGPLALTDAGRAAVRAWLGVPSDAAAATWKDVSAKWLPAATVPAEDRAAFADDSRVVGLLLGRALDVGPAASVSDAIEAAVCRDLGHADCRTVDALVAKVIGKRLDVELPALKPAARDKQVARAAFGMTEDPKPATVRKAAVKRWAMAHGAEPSGSAAGSSESTGPAAEPLGSVGSVGGAVDADDLASFAATVNAAAAASPTGRFGASKVFISHVYRQLNGPIGIEAFKQRLVEANTAGLVRLVRADLVSAMDPADVRESATHHLGAEFHFVLAEPGRAS